MAPQVWKSFKGGSEKLRIKIQLIKKKNPGLIKHDGLCRSAITTSTSSLLIICLNRLCDPVVDDPSCIWLINPHPKSRGGDDHLDMAMDEIFMSCVPHFKGNLPVVSHSFDPNLGKAAADFFGFVDDWTVDQNGGLLGICES